MIDSPMNVTWGGEAKIAGEDASHLPLVERRTLVQRDSHRGLTVLALHQLVRHQLGVLQRDPPQLGLHPKHCRQGVLHQNSHHLALNRKSANWWNFTGNHNNLN